MLAQGPLEVALLVGAQHGRQVGVTQHGFEAPLLLGVQRERALGVMARLLHMPEVRADARKVAEGRARQALVPVVQLHAQRLSERRLRAQQVESSARRRLHLQHHTAQVELVRWQVLQRLRRELAHTGPVVPERRHERLLHEAQREQEVLVVVQARDSALQVGVGALGLAFERERHGQHRAKKRARQDLGIGKERRPTQHGIVAVAHVQSLPVVHDDLAHPCVVASIGRHLHRRVEVAVLFEPRARGCAQSRSVEVVRAIETLAEQIG